MGLAGVVNNGEKLDQIQARLQPGPKLAPVPKNCPPNTKSWHVVRDGKVDRVCKILGGDGGPAVAALVGWSGAGKTTAAAAMVGERGPIRPRAGENEDQARTRLDRVRVLFPGGVVWLRVGKGEGAADRLPTLMLELAKRLHKDVMEEGVDAPKVDEAGESYVKNMVSQEKLRCLVVADDVWEGKVVEKLRDTGMWVLLTTRFPEMVEPNERVVMNTLTDTEAKDVLRGAAELSPDAHLCDAAENVLKICDLVAMDIAFVGSWSSVRTTDGEPKSNKAWARTVVEIEAEGGGVDVERDANRLAVLRSGFKYLAMEDPLAQELYAELAVFPAVDAFGESDAVVLLDNGEVAKGPISILERWGVLQVDASEKYRMHDAHVDFARKKLRGWEDIRKPAVERWTFHVSRLDIAIRIDVYALLNIWRALERVGGDGWWVTRPYDDQLVQMDASDPSKILAVHVVAELYEHDEKFGELEPIMQKVLEDSNAHSPEVQMAALYHAGISLYSQWRREEFREVERRLCELGRPRLLLPPPSAGVSFSQISTTYSIYGVCMKAAGHLKEAEEWFRKALKAQETGGLTASYQSVWAMHELGECAAEAGRFEEAEPLFKRVLEIQEAKLGPDHRSVAVTLDGMGRCVRDAGRPGEAEALFQRALEIQRSGPDDLESCFV